MDLQKWLALWPQVQAAFAAQGVTLTLPQALALVPIIQQIIKGASPAPTPSGPTLPTVLALGADANLAPYGVALVGFSPQDHQGANLRDPANAKYIAYAYLVANKIAPTLTWAPAAAQCLAAQVPAVPWQAADTQTLIYGDEYIHTAPLGWGAADLRGRTDLDPNEFIWSAFGS